MKIAIATGIYPPEIGGSGFYAQYLKEALERQGHTVRLVLYGGLKKLPTGIRHAAYAIKLWWSVRGTDGVIAFDTFSVAIPASLVAMVTGIPTVNRAGGDFVWETYIERTKDFLPIPYFYAHRDRWNLKERVSFRMIKWALSHVDVAFSSAWQRDIWRKEYGFDPARVHVVENAIEGRLDPIPPVRKNFLFYSRKIALKNHEAFRRAFKTAQKAYPDIELEEGVLPHGELMERMRACYAVVLPSISDITPNYIIDSIRCGKPFLLTKYSGYADRFKEYGVCVDPLREDDMRSGIERLADPTVYETIRARIASFDERRTYETIAREYVGLLAKISTKKFP